MISMNAKVIDSVKADERQATLATLGCVAVVAALFLSLSVIIGVLIGYSAADSLRAGVAIGALLFTFIGIGCIVNGLG
jgi:hypothetical protein